MVRKATWRQVRLVQRKPENKVSRSIGLVSGKREFWAAVGQSWSATDNAGVTQKNGHGDSVYIHHSFGKILREKKRRTCGVKFEREVGMRDFSLMGYVFRMREKTQL